MKKIDKYIFIFFGLAVVILWQALLPGYVLSLDMIFIPNMETVINRDGFLNGLPINYLFFLFGFILPVWIIQKIIFLILFSAFGYLTYKYLPVGDNKAVRLFCAMFYMANPFVYGRFLAGQWAHLVGYAILPLFIYTLVCFKEKQDFKSALKVFGSLFLICLFSVHYFMMASLVLVFYCLYYLVKFILRKKNVEFKLMLKNVLLAGVVFLIISSYWLVPAFSRSAPIEQRFGNEHWQAFSAGGYKNIGTFLNVASLNGFWGERNPWAKYFLWPQDFTWFWLAFVLLTGLCLIGLIEGLKNAQKRPLALFFGLLGVLSLIFATGAGETIFKGFNLWFYNHIPFWAGFRDSQKFSAFLALSYAYFVGIGLEQTINVIKSKKPALEKTFLSFIFIVPIAFGFLLWGGFRGQIQPVWYPASWFEAKQIIDSDNSDFKVLFLPWHGYLSFAFNNNLVISNPAKRFFGDRAITSKSVELDEIYNQEQNKDYLALDKMIIGEGNKSLDEVAIDLKNRGIKYVVFFQDLKSADNLKYEFLESDRFNQILKTKEVWMYKIVGF